MFVCFCSSQGCPYFFYSPCSFQPNTANHLSWRRLNLWNRSCNFSCLPRRFRTTKAFASRTLTKSEKNYAQLEKEALSLVYGIKKFHQYLYGCKFILITDHKPLLSILGPSSGIPSLAAARLQRWVNLLSACTYTIRFRSTQGHANADSLSRLPLKTDDTEQESESSLYNLSQLDTLPVTSLQIQQSTVKDPVLSKVWRYTRDGWPTIIPDDLLPYFR